jgi:hypothetical protein
MFPPLLESQIAKTKSREKLVDFNEMICHTKKVAEVCHEVAHRAEGEL